MTITIPAHLLEDHDFCHRAAVDAVATALGVNPVLLSASWTTEEREEISVELPDSTGLDVLERLGVAAAIRALPREPYSEASE